MSHLCDSISERNFDVTRTSTAQQTTSQPFRSKSSLNNRVPDQTPTKQTTKKSPKHPAMSRGRKQGQGETGVSPKTLNNTSITNVTAACQNLNINVVNDVAVQGDTPKRKNAAKKGKKLKQLQMPTPGNPPQIAPTQLTAPPNLNPGHNDYSKSVQDFFLKQAPMYSNANSRYFENLSHHPQFQLNQGMQIGRELLNPQLPANGQHPTNNPYSVHNQYPANTQLQGNAQFMSSSQYQLNAHYATSAPNTPQYLLPQSQQSMSFPNSPMLQSNFMSQKCLQNVMQHPLLAQTFNTQLRKQLEKQATGEGTSAQADKSTPSTPKHKRNRRKGKSSAEIKFDAYLLPELVEAGLKNNTLIEGVIRINPKQFQHSYVSSYDRSEQDILIDGLKNRNRALEGDLVVVQYIDNDNDEATGENRQKKGKVVFIKEKVHNRTCIGNLKPLPDNNRQKALFIPRDHRIPRLNIPFTSWPDNFYEDYKNYDNTLFLAKIVDWTDTRFAMGVIVQHIGQSGDMVSETRSILAQTDLDIKPFGPEVRHLYPRLDYKISDEELQIREDCRKLCLFSIDPSNCRDIDDAVSCKILNNGNYEIGVHIADVAHFLTENTILDEQVSDKATTIYLVEKAYHMLPDELCMLCSLFPGVDKLAFSVFWEITENGEVLSHRFAKTVINSCAQLSYDHAQSVLEDKDDAEVSFPETYNGFVYNDIYKILKILGKISAKFRTDRFDGGALRIDQPKVSFRLNAADGLPVSFTIYESKESHQLIEEFMLLANMTVANRIREDHPKLAFLRCHPPPSAFMLKQLANSLKPMGIELDISSAGDLHKSLIPHVGPTSTDKGKVMVLNMLCAKPMTRAKYFCADGCDDEDFHHYALNVPLYTHFTSPIRRYADIMVHRLLAASLKYREEPKWAIDHVRMIAAQCNKQKYNAKKANEMSTELFTLKYIEMNSPLETEAAVVEVREKYIDVIIIAMGLNRRIFFNNDFPGKYECIKHEGGAKLSKMQLTWQAVKNMSEITQIIQVFSILQVELYKDDDLCKIDIRLVRPQ